MGALCISEYDYFLVTSFVKAIILGISFSFLVTEMLDFGLELISFPPTNPTQWLTAGIVLVLGILGLTLIIMELNMIGNLKEMGG